VKIAVVIQTAAAMRMETEIGTETAVGTMDADIIGVDMIDVATVITTNGAGANMNGGTIVGRRGLICIPITTINTAPTLTTTVIAMGCPRGQTMLAAAKATIPSARTFTNTRAADFFQSLAIPSPTASLIVMVFCAVTKKGSRIGTIIF